MIVFFVFFVEWLVGVKCFGFFYVCMVGCDEGMYFVICLNMVEKVVGCL